MKNQYFGDNRDLFKYDFIDFIFKNNKISSIDSFTFIPMLTENNNRNDGNQTKIDKAKAGTKNAGLIAYLRECRAENRKNITEIKNYFLNHGIAIKIYGENEFPVHGKYFEHKGRANYFEKIDPKLLSKALIFVDPDNGLQVMKSNEKHLLYSEVRSLNERMDKNSILMIYQHFPRENHIKYLARRSNELNDITGNSPIYISDNEIIFFLLTKNDTMKDHLAKIITQYNESYKNLKIGNINLGKFIANNIN